MAKIKNSVSKENKMRRDAERRAVELNSRKSTQQMKLAGWIAGFLAVIAFTFFAATNGIIDLNDMLTMFSVSILGALMIFMVFGSGSKLSQINRELEVLRIKANDDYSEVK